MFIGLKYLLNIERWMKLFILVVFVRGSMEEGLSFCLCVNWMF